MWDCFIAENASLSDQQLQQNEKVGESEESLNLNEEKGNNNGKSSPNYEESDELQERYIQLFSHG